MPIPLESGYLPSVPHDTQKLWESILVRIEAPHQALVAVLQGMSTGHDCYQSVAINWMGESEATSWVGLTMQYS